ncbi:MAG: pitrilysin family protein [Acidobacteriota bacterium]
MERVLLPNSSPLVSFRLLFNTGAASDPAGKEGVASLTSAMMAAGGTRRLSYEEIVRRMYPMATAFLSQVDKEMTVFYGTTHRDNLEEYYRIISQMTLDPGWREDDFARLREDAINFLKVNLRGNNDEELAKEELYNFIYRRHPYGHHSAGTILSLERITLDDVKDFYHRHITSANLVIGLAGGYPTGFDERVEKDFAVALSQGEASKTDLPEPEKIRGLEMRVISKDTRGTAISFGFPIRVTRSHRDWPALMVAQSWLGQHRSSNSHLYQRLRQIRGLNYGDYAYIEYFPRGMFQFYADPNLARGQQIFQVWIRPVEPPNAIFALRCALFELRKLVETGMSEEAFESTRLFLKKFVNVLTRTQDSQLGYALDSRYFGIPPFVEYVRDRLEHLTVDEVNGAIREHLQADDIKTVVVAKEAEGFVEAALSDEPSPISYASPPGEDVLAEDRLIETYPLGINRSAVEIIPVEKIFQE